MVEKLEKEKQLNDIFHALSSLPRRKIIELLREFNEMKVGAIAEVFDMSLNGVSKHLKVLEKASMIKRHIEGRVHTIRLDWQALEKGYDWLHFYHDFWSKRLDNVANHFEK